MVPAIALALVSVAGAPAPVQTQEADAEADLADVELFPAPDPTLPPDRHFVVPVRVEQLELLPDGTEAIAVMSVRSIDLWKVVVGLWVEIALAILAVSGTIVLAIAIRKARQPREPHCRRCRYLLVALACDRCPECGRLLRARDRVAGGRGRIAAFVTAAALLSGAGALVAARGSLPRHGAAVDWLHWESRALGRWDWFRGLLNRASVQAESARSFVVRLDLEQGRITQMLTEGPVAEILVHPDGESFFLLRWDAIEHRCISDGRLQARLDCSFYSGSEERFGLGLDPDRGTIFLHHGTRIEAWWYAEGVSERIFDEPYEWHDYFRGRAGSPQYRPYRVREMPCLVPGRPMFLARLQPEAEPWFDYMAWDLGETATRRVLPVTAMGWAPGFSPDGCWLVDFVVTNSGICSSVRVWNLDTGELRCDVPAPASMTLQYPSRLMIDESARYVMGVTVQGGFGSWHLLDLDSGRCFDLHSGPYAPFPRFASSRRHGTRLVVLSPMSMTDSTIRIWDLP